MLIMLRNNTIDTELQQQLDALPATDAVLLMGDAVYLAHGEGLQTAGHVFIYGPDADARGLKYDSDKSDYELVSDHELVNLSEQYSTWIKWQ
ncbi:hypothetical protein IT774_07330 [Salinimonas marina]|uniref:Uncharacterized protein n=1 Tax=Salinimonas marina TaxID=2785918 RepID=A0A7S9DZR0_9ALTE|nr:DsrH/TusB family sulfur metabolism protein [Salinimonas marina]QPG06914.1 hypothetical protein IT774_07330 [Salinimonas marina]